MKRNKQAPLARLIRDAREAKGLTQDQLGEYSGCDRSTVAGWEDEENPRGHSAIIRAVRILRSLKRLGLRLKQIEGTET